MLKNSLWIILLSCSMLLSAYGETNTTATEASPLKENVILLAGETAEWAPTGSKSAEIDLTTTAGALLNGTVVSKLVKNEKIADTESRLQDLVAAEPTIAIVFTGAADEAAKTRDEQQVEAVTRISKGLTAKGARVFIIPSRTTIGAGTSANLRIGASAGNARFVEPGTEYEAMPYEEAIREVARIAEGSQQSQVFQLSPITETSTVAPVPPGTEPVDSAATGTRTVRAEPGATPFVGNYQPPPPLKQFSPKKPVPVKPSRKKIPGFAR